MADATLKKLAALAHEADDVELRRAAVLVLGRVATTRDEEAVQTLLACLDGEHEETRLAAIDALGRLKAESALPRLVDFVRRGGPELEAAARAAGALGARGTRAIEKLLNEVHPFQRRRIAAGLALGGTQSAALATAHALLDADPTVVDAAAKTLARELPTWSAARRNTLADDLRQQLKAKRQPPLPASSETAMLRVLAALHDESAVDLFWDRLSADHPKDVRLIAIQAIGGFASPANEERMRLLMDCALERDFQLAAPALMVLQRLSVAPKHLPHWRRLLEAPDPATRKLAIEKLAGLNDAAVADALLAQVRHPDRQLRDAALSALQRTPRGRAALERGLLEAAGADEAWSLARAQVELAREWKPAQRRRIFDKLCAYHQADDRRADALFFLLRETNHDGTRDELAARAAELRKKKKFAEALALYKLLTRDPASGEMLRFDMAATGLKLSPKDLAPESRQADPCLGHFARLLQDRGFDLAGLVAKAKWLDADDLYYLGFHFVEHNHRERDFGAEVLRLVIRRRPNSSAAKDARRKLKSEGLTG